MLSIRLERSAVEVPVALLENDSLTASEKLIWAIAALDSTSEQRAGQSQSMLGSRAGFCRQTIGKAEARLRGLRWYEPKAQLRLPQQLRPRGQKVMVPARLLLDTSLGTDARVLYMRLLAMAAQGEALRFRLAWLTERCALGVKSARKAMKQLRQAKWLGVEQANRVSPMQAVVRDPVRELFQEMAVAFLRGVEIAKYKAEAIMRGILTVVADSTRYSDGGFLGPMVNPETGAQLQIDRHYYEDNVGFESNGTQHDHATERYDEKTVASQRARDAVKMKCAEEMGMKLMVVRPEDLSPGRLLEMVTELLPLRNLVGAEDLIALMDRICAGYQRAWRRATRPPTPQRDHTRELSPGAHPGRQGC